MSTLYYESPYLKEWDTEIKEIIESEGKILAILKDTAFYPEGGGQPADRGYINDIEVIDVFEKDKIIFHVLSKTPENIEVNCRLDFSRRYDHMQQHTGQHLLSSVFYRLYGGETSSFHLGQDYVSIDISLENISEDMVEAIEKEANTLIYRNLQVKTYITEKDGLKNLPLRKIPKVEEDIRIVGIDNLDYSPCCGTHVPSTGCIGIIKIIKTEKYKGLTRVYFKCGNRALLDYSEKHNAVIALSRILSVDMKEIVERIISNENQLKDISKQNKELREKLVTVEAEKLIKEKGPNIIIKIDEERTFDEVQLLARKILDLGAVKLIMASLMDMKIYVAHDGTCPLNIGKIFKESLTEFNGRGGGGERQAQAAFKNEEDIRRYICFLEKII